MDEEEEGKQPLTTATYREEMHAIRGALNKIALRVETIYLMLCKMTGKEPKS